MIVFIQAFLFLLRLWAGFLGAVPAARKKLTESKFDVELKRFQSKRVLQKQPTSSTADLEALALKLPDAPCPPAQAIGDPVSVLQPSVALVLDGTVVDSSAVTPISTPVKRSLLPARMELLNECCKAGVVVAPSLLLPGQNGVFAVREIASQEFLFSAPGRPPAWTVLFIE